MFLAGVMFLISFFGMLMSPKVSDGTLEFPVGETLHTEKRIALLDRFTPWLVVMFILILIAYVPALQDVLSNAGPGSLPFTPDNPVPVK